MCSLMSVTRPALLAAAAVLAGCSSSRPSDTDIEKALSAEAGALALFGVKAEITDVDRGQCHDAGEGRLRCTFKYTVKGNGQEVTNEDSAIFESREDGWVKVGR